MRRMLILSVFQSLLLLQDLFQEALGATNRDDGYTDVCQGHALILYSSVATDNSTHDPYLPSEYLYDGGYNGG